MKRLTYTLVVCSSVAAWANPSKTVIIDCGDTFDASGARIANLLLSLAHTLRVNKQARQFRVMWFVAAPNSPDSCTVFYDRRAEVLRFFSRGEIGGLGNENIPTQYTRWRLKHVSDAMIFRLAQQARVHQQQLEDSDDSFFFDLTKLGAKRF